MVIFMYLMAEPYVSSIENIGFRHEIPRDLLRETLIINKCFLFKSVKVVYGLLIGLGEAFTKWYKKSSYEIRNCLIFFVDQPGIHKYPFILLIINTVLLCGT